MIKIHHKYTCTLGYKLSLEQETLISEHRVIIESLKKKANYVIIFLRQEQHL